MSAEFITKTLWTFVVVFRGLDEEIAKNLKRPFCLDKTKGVKQVKVFIQLRSFYADSIKDFREVCLMPMFPDQQPAFSFFFFKF